MAVLCKICEKVFSTQCNLNKHLKNTHNSKRNIVSYDKSICNFKCLEKDCNSSFKQNSFLINHLCEKHNFHFEEDKFEFTNATGS